MPSFNRSSAVSNSVSWSAAASRRVLISWALCKWGDRRCIRAISHLYTCPCRSLRWTATTAIRSGVCRAPRKRNSAGRSSEEDLKRKMIQHGVAGALRRFASYNTVAAVKFLILRRRVVIEGSTRHPHWRCESLRSDSIGTCSGLEQLFAGLMIVAVVQAGTPTTSYVVAERCGPTNCCVLHRRDVQRGLAARS
jgi:hypothetical protein